MLFKQTGPLLGTLKAEYFHLATIEGIEALEAGV
jgi:hypothetical protein